MTPPRRNGLSERQLEFIAIGGAVGAGLFLASGQGIHLAGPAILLGYIVGGLMVFIVARALGEMAMADMKPSIPARYIERYIGPRTAFVQAWSYWICLVLICMAELTAGAKFMQYWLPTMPLWVTELIGLAIVFAINRLKVRVFGEIEFWISLLKISAIVAFLAVGALVLAGAGFVRLPGASIHNLWRFGGFMPNGLNGLLSAFPIALFAFGGTELIAIAAADAENPDRSVPRAINGLLLRLGLFYVGTILLIMCLESWSSVPTNSSPMVQLLARIGVPATATLMNIILVSAMLSGCNSAVYASTRMLRVLAEMGAAPTKLAELNSRGVPGRAVTLMLAVASISILLSRIIPDSLFGLLLQTATIGLLINWTLFLLANLGFRKARPAAGARRFPVPGGPWSIYVVLTLIAGTFLLEFADPHMRLPVALAATALAALAAIATLWSSRKAALNPA